MTTAPLLRVTGLGKSFGGVRAVDAVAFDLAPGELLALIGPNGAGKSTTFNMLNGQLRADRGSIALGDVELVGRKPRDIWRLGVGRTFQIAETFASLIVAENVQMALLSHDRRLWSMWRRAADHRRDDALALLDQVGMRAEADRPAGELAYGDVKRIELAIALAHDPRLLLRDEPTAGMAPGERHALMALTRRLVNERGTAVLFTEHNMDVVFALMGRNGAGKSTTLKALIGLLGPRGRRGGAVHFMGSDISGAEPHEAARRGLGYVPEDRRIFTDLSVLENLEVGRQPARRRPGDGADAAPAPAWTPERLFALFPNLGEMPRRAGGRMSGGEQKMLTVARTLMGNPWVVLLDEPSEGVAPVIVEQMAGMILALKAEGVSILLSEQNTHFAALVADRACVLEKGEVRFRGSMAELAANAEVRRQFLDL